MGNSNFMNLPNPKTKSKARFYVTNFVIQTNKSKKPLTERFTYLIRLFEILHSPFFRISSFFAFALHSFFLNITRFLESTLAGIVAVFKIIWTFDVKIWHNLFTFGFYLQLKLWLALRAVVHPKGIASIQDLGSSIETKDRIGPM